MARTVITISDINPQESVGLTFEDADAMNGMMFLNDGTCLLVVKNDSAMDAVEVTIVAVPDEAGRAVDYVKEVAAGDTEVFGVYLPAWWNQTFTNSGYVYVDFDVDTDVKVGVINF
jgi:hypothetical protein